MFRRKLLLGPREVDLLWGFWWAAISKTTEVLKSETKSLGEYDVLKRNSELFDIVEEFYVGIEWLERLEK